MISIDTAALVFTLFISLSVNCYLVFQIRKKPKRPPSLELREFLTDLSGGLAMAAFSPDGNVARVDPSNILMRSPKSK